MVSAGIKATALMARRIHTQASKDNLEHSTLRSYVVVALRLIHRQ